MQKGQNFSGLPPTIMTFYFKPDKNGRMEFAMIYFDNAATTLRKPPCVIQAVSDAMISSGNVGRGAHAASLGSAKLVFETRQRICELFHGDSEQFVCFTQNSTEALNIVLQGLFSKGDHVITTSLEHNSVLRPLYLEETRGITLTIIPADPVGNISYDTLEHAIRPETKAVVCTHASNLTGNVLDLFRIGEICERHDILLIVDVSQSAGVLPIDMQKMHIDVLCFTGHKGLLGPQGTGGICMKKGIKIRPLLVGGSGIHSYEKHHPTNMPEALEAGTLNVHGLAGLHASLGYLKDQGVQHLYEKEHALMTAFYEGIKKIPEVKIYGDFTAKLRAPIVTLNIGDYDSALVSDELAERFGICTRAGAHCAPLMHQCLGTVKQGAVRFSFSSFNTMEEVKKGISAIQILACEE